MDNTRESGLYLGDLSEEDSIREGVQDGSDNDDDDDDTKSRHDVMNSLKKKTLKDYDRV